MPALHAQSFFDIRSPKSPYACSLLRGYSILNANCLDDRYYKCPALQLAFTVVTSHLTGLMSELSDNCQCHHGLSLPCLSF